MTVKIGGYDGYHSLSLHITLPLTHPMDTPLLLQSIAETQELYR